MLLITASPSQLSFLLSAIWSATKIYEIHLYNHIHFWHSLTCCSCSTYCTCSLSQSIHVSSMISKGWPPIDHASMFLIISSCNWIQNTQSWKRINLPWFTFLDSFAARIMILVWAVDMQGLTIKKRSAGSRPGPVSTYRVNTSTLLQFDHRSKMNVASRVTSNYSENSRNWKQNLGKGVEDRHSLISFIKYIQTENLDVLWGYLHGQICR